jgi:hypothetical protein
MKEFAKVYGSCVAKYLIKQERVQAALLKSTSWCAGQDLRSEREELMDYLFDLCYDLDYAAPTSQLAVTLVDAFLNRKQVKGASVLKLVGLVCLMIASKHLELKGLNPKEVSLISHSSYRESDIRTLEQFVLATLEWNLSLPTAAEISRNLLCPELSGLDTETLAKSADNYASLCYADAELVTRGPVAIAIGSVCAALRKLGYDDYALEWVSSLRDKWRIDTRAGAALCSEIRVKIAAVSTLTRSDSSSTCDSD